MGTGSGIPVSVSASAGTTDLSAPVVARPSLPLELWREAMGYHPWHFWGLANDRLPVTSACNTIVGEWSWQAANQAGRADIRQAIMIAERKLAQHLGFNTIPRWGNSVIAWPRYSDQRITRWASAGDASARRIGVKLDVGYVEAVGVETTTQIASDAPITYSDSDGDGINETAAISVVTSVIDPREIAVYFAASDRVGQFEDNRILPVNVSINAGVAAITFPTWLCVRPVNYRRSALAALNPDDTGVLASTVDIYRKYTAIDGNTAASCQALLVWDTEPSCAECATLRPANSSDPASIAVAISRCGVRDARNGVVLPAEAVYDPVTGAWSQACNWYRAPDRVIVRHYSGYPLLADGSVSRDIVEMVSRLAAAELDERICACDTANRALYRWQYDMTRTGTTDEQYTVSQEDLNCSFGSRRGHIDAWRRVRQMALVSSLSV